VTCPEREQAVLDGYRDTIAKAVFWFTVRCLAHLGYLPDLDAAPLGIVGTQLTATIPLRCFWNRPARRTEILAPARTVLAYHRWNPKARESTP